MNFIEKTDSYLLLCLYSSMLSADGLTLFIWFITYIFVNLFYIKTIFAWRKNYAKTNFICFINCRNLYRSGNACSSDSSCKIGNYSEYSYYCRNLAVKLLYFAGRGWIKSSVGKRSVLGRIGKIFFGKRRAGGRRNQCEASFVCGFDGLFIRNFLDYSKINGSLFRNVDFFGVNWNVRGFILHDSSVFSDKNGFFHENISSIDLRFHDRIILTKKKTSDS